MRLLAPLISGVRWFKKLILAPITIIKLYYTCFKIFEYIYESMPLGNPVDNFIFRDYLFVGDLE